MKTPLEESVSSILSSGNYCTICVDPEAYKINEALMRGASCPQVASRYGVSVHALRRHRANHLRVFLYEAREAREEEQRELGLTFLDQLQDLHDQTLAILGQAERQGNIRGMLAAVREARRSLEFLGKMTAQVPSAPAAAPQVNILVVLQKVEVRNAVLAALEPFPDARAALAACLEAPAPVPVE
jgi:hypothetical protein